MVMRGSSLLSWRSFFAAPRLSRRASFKNRGKLASLARERERERGTRGLCCCCVVLALGDDLREVERFEAEKGRHTRHLLRPLFSKGQSQTRLERDSSTFHWFPTHNKGITPPFDPPPFVRSLTAMRRSRIRARERDESACVFDPLLESERPNARFWRRSSVPPPRSQRRSPSRTRRGGRWIAPRGSE